MTRTIHCDQQDIIEILAEYFKTDRDNVKLDFCKTYKDCDMMDYEVYGVYADIKDERMELDNSITTLYIVEFGDFTRRSHVDITSNFIDEINKRLNLESDNEDGIEITIDHIKEAMINSNGEYPLIMLKDHYNGEFELHDFISDYMYDSIYFGTIVQVTDSIEEDDLNEVEWSENREIWK